MFTFQQFTLHDEHCAMKVGTDGVLLGAWCPAERGAHLLDMGCGCGVVSLMMAQRAPQAQVTGVEIDPHAAADAAANVAASPWPGRVHIACCDVAVLPTPPGGYDGVAANPPYHEEELLPPDARRATARHTSGGGLTFSALLHQADRLLAHREGAWFCVVLPAQAESAFTALAAAWGLHPCRIAEVVTRTGKPAKRVLMEFSRTPQPVCRTSLPLSNDKGCRSEAYQTLCKDFYLTEEQKRALSRA